MKLSKNLVNLANLFPVPLYVVGGAVRDSLLGYENYDIDLASQMTPTEVEKILENSEFYVVSASKKLGTVVIVCQDERYEYTTFRVDSYANDGSHEPLEVSFTKDIKEDAFRRDFSINAIYFDIKGGNYVDPTMGIRDLEQKIIRTTGNAERVFKEDALRILRMVRLASQLGFEVEKATFEAAKTLVPTIKMLAVERIRDEFDKMIHSDCVNNIRFAHYRAVMMLDKIGGMDYVIWELKEGKGVAQKPEYHIYDVFNHIMEVFKQSANSVRLAALLHDIAKPKMFKETGRMAGHDKEGGIMAKLILRRLKYPNKVIDRTARLVESHMYDLKCETGEKKLRQFIVKNIDIIEDLILLKNADSLGGKFLSENPSAKRLKELLQTMKEENVPFSVKELQVKGQDLIDLDIPENKRSEALNGLLMAAASGKLNDRESQLKVLKGI